MKRIILTLIIFVLALFKGTAQEGAAKSALAEGDYQAAIKLYQVAIATCNNENKSADLYNSITNAQKCEELLGQANEAYKKKKYSEAKKLYQSILKYNPSDKFSKKRVSLCSNNTSKPSNTNTQNTNKESKPSSTYSQNTTKESKPSNGTANGHEYVDLGLPSGLKWATCNVGATSPEDYGDYFAWGEIETKSSYTLYNSFARNERNLNGKNFGDIKGNAKYDAAAAKWGGNWRLPTKAELEELKNKCTWKWTTQGGKKGYKITGPNGNSIFLPAAGKRYNQSLHNINEGSYWSSTPRDENGVYAHLLSFGSSSNSKCVGSYEFVYGCSIRPVIK